MRFSIIIINYKTFEHTKNCLKSVFSNCKLNKFEVVLVDNDSGDGSAEKLQEKFGSKIKLIKSDKNRGFGGGNNLGAKNAEGDILLFLNSDTLIKEDILAWAEEKFQKNKVLGILAPKLILSDKTEQPKAFGDFPKIFNVLIEKFRQKKKESGKIFETEWVSGACFFIKKDIFEDLGGFDENFFMYFEDIDLCKRVKRRNLKILVDKSFSVVHLVGVSGESNKKTKKYYYASQNYFYKKHYGYLNLFLIKIFRLPLKIKLFFRI